MTEYSLTLPDAISQRAYAFSAVGLQTKSATVRQTLPSLAIKDAVARPASEPPNFFCFQNCFAQGYFDNASQGTSMLVPGQVFHRLCTGTNGEDWNG